MSSTDRTQGTTGRLRDHSPARGTIVTTKAEFAALYALLLPMMPLVIERRAAVLTPPQAMGRYLETFDWHHFVTLTVAGVIGKAGLAARFQKGFIRELAAAAQQSVPYFFAIEQPGGPGVAPHVHALIAGTASLTVDRIASAWAHGFTDVHVYDRNRGAALYSAKGLLLDPDGYDFSSRAPRRLLDARANATRAMLDTAALRWG